MNLSKDKVTEIFYFADNFCKGFHKSIEAHAIEESGKARRDVLSWGIHLVTGIKNNMKNTLVELKDKILLRKRSVIETVNDELKTMCQIEHSRHRSFTNFLTNTLAAMIAYSFFPKKPAIKFEVVTTNQLPLF